MHFHNSTSVSGSLIHQSQHSPVSSHQQLVTFLVFLCVSALPCLALLDLIKDCYFEFILVSVVLIPPRCVCTVQKSNPPPSAGKSSPPASADTSPPAVATSSLPAAQFSALIQAPERPPVSVLAPARPPVSASPRAMSCEMCHIEDLAGEGDGAVYPSVAVSPCRFLNGDW